ncbi:MAG TPA: DUF624 domain-containing protein [Herpetosiphonaceae bacterium]|nr:DUF624 domain-containing protein [Herpetosiphonaceae bacterium]
MQKSATRPPSVRIAFRTFWRTLRHGYDNLGTLGISSIFWWLCAIPAAPFVYVAFDSTNIVSALVLFVALLIVPLGPASAALSRIVKPMTEERASSFHPFWQHLRSDWRWSTELMWTLLLGLVLWEANRRFYAASTNAVIMLLSGFFLVVVLLWVGVMVFAMPMALRQTEQRLRTTMRNVAVVVLANIPGVLVSLLLLFLSTLLLLFLPPLFLLIPGWIALWAAENVRLLLVAAGHLEPDEIADRPRGR